MSGAARSRLARWLRGKRLSSTALGVPYLLLAVLAAMTLPHKDHHAAMVLGLSLCALAAAWMLLLETLNRSWLGAAQPAVFVTGLIVITAALIILDSWFGFFAAVCFGYARTRLRWPRQQAGAAGCALLAAVSQTEDSQVSLPLHLTFFAFALTLDLLLCCSLMWLLWGREQQIAQHQQALVELTAANLRLEATIIENDALHQQLITQAREAGILDERRRMAREIHDTLAQGFTGIVTQLQATERAADDPVRWRRHLTAATGLAREGLTEARRSVHALRPEPLETARLSEALAGVAERWSTLNGVPVQVTTTGTVRRVQPEAEFALLRAAQEALANVARHARATRVGLTVSYLENEVALDVRDDGVGFDATQLAPAHFTPTAHLTHTAQPARAAQPGGGGFGLVAMRQRIEGVAGTLQVESEPGGGTAISACVPTVPALAES